MIAVSVPPVTAWQLLHADLTVLNLPTPAPLVECTYCDGTGFVDTGRRMFNGAWHDNVPVNCDECGWSGLAPVEVLIYATDEWEWSGRNAWGEPVKFAGIATLALRDGRVERANASVALGYEPVRLNHVVGVATITGSHEARECITADPSTDCSPHARLSWSGECWHWAVGSVRSITPIPWQPAACELCEGLGGFPTPNKFHYAYMGAVEPGSTMEGPCPDCDGSGAAGPVWSVPDELAEQTKENTQ